jgi:hypothetical protein
MKHNFKIGDSLICKSIPITENNISTIRDVQIFFDPKYIDKEGFIEIIGFGKIHINNFELEKS